MKDYFFLKNRYTTFTVFLTALAVLLLLFAGTYKLSEAPAIWLDEGFYSELGVNIAQTGQNAFQIAPGTFAHSSYVSVGYPLLYPLAVSYKLFGAGVLQGRAVMMLFILLFAAASYLLVRKLFGPLTAAWSLLVIASFAQLYGNGKSVLGEVPGLFFLAATLAALCYLEESNYQSTVRYIAVGFLAGLCVATKPIFIVALAALGIAWLLRIKTTPVTLRGFIFGLVGFLVPFVFWIYTQFGVDVTLMSVIRDYINPYSGPGTQAVAPSTILQNIRRFITEATPMYAALLTLVWAWALWLRRKTASVAELAAFFFCALIILAYLRLPGWYRYLFPATALALLFLPSSALAVYGYLQTKISLLRKFWWLPYAALALLFLGQTYQVFFSSYVADYYHGTRTHDTSMALKALPAGASVFLYDTPELGVLMPSRNYYQYLELSAQSTLGADELSVLRQGGVDYAVVPKGTDIDPSLLDKFSALEVVDRYQIYKRSDLGK